MSGTLAMTNVTISRRALKGAPNTAIANDLTNESYDPELRPDGRRIVSLIGDASIVNGVAMEGVYQAGFTDCVFDSNAQDGLNARVSAGVSFNTCDFSRHLLPQKLP